MKKVFVPLCTIILLLSLWGHRSAFAKGDTAKITITGAGLAHTIEVTDHRLTDLSGWGGPSTEGEAKEPDPGRPFYEVSSYFETPVHDLQKNYVVFYYPPCANERGIIYRPGKGVVWELNVSSVLRQGKDGKWMYATPAWDTAWEAVVHPSIVRPMTGVSHKPTPIKVDTWTAPHPGWLYVLDPLSESNAPGSRIWLLDPETGKTMGSIRAGYEPDIALSSDGRHLYIASGERESGELAVVDTSHGTLRRIPFPDRVLYRPHYRDMPPFAGMMAAADGRTLWIPAQHVFAPDRIESELSAFDTRSEKFLTGKISLGNCGYGDFVPSSDPGEFAFVCDGFISDSNRIRFLSLDAERQVRSNVSSGLPWSKTCGVAKAFLSRDGKQMQIVRTDGATYEMETTSLRLRPAGIPDDCHNWSIVPSEWPLSADGSKLYLGYGGATQDNLSVANALRVLDVATWSELGHIQSSVPFWSAVVTEDGTHVHAAAPAKHLLVVFDAIRFREERTIEVGITPSLVIVAR